MPEFITIYRHGIPARLVTVEEFNRMDGLTDDDLADVPEHVTAAAQEAIDDETAADLARYGIAL